ncbi:MAG: hypothetical protein ABUK11_03905 [Mariprofundaceae bacterium]
MDGLPKSITPVIDFVSKGKTDTISQDSEIGRQPGAAQQCKAWMPNITFGSA